MRHATLCPLLLLLSTISTCDGGKPSHLRPIILVPGIGGSILDSRHKETNEVNRVWLRYSSAEEVIKEQMYVRYNADTGVAEQLHPLYDEVSVPVDEYGLYAISNLNPHMKLPRTLTENLYYFHDLIENLKSLGYEPGKTLFGFPYDWRQSNGYTVHLKKLSSLVRFAQGNAAKPVDIVSHSMGGLLMLAYFHQYPSDVELVRNWVTFGTPFLGSPKALNAALQGENFAFSKVDLWTGHQLLLQCPSFYELLPHPSGWQRQPRIIVRDHSANYTIFPTVDDCIALLDAANAQNTLTSTSDQPPTPWPFRMDMYNRSKLLHESVESAFVPRRFFLVYGYGQETPFDLTFEEGWDGHQASLLHNNPTFSWVDGDGSVPTESATSDRGRSLHKLGVRSEHMALLKQPESMEAVLHYLSIGCSWAGTWETSLGLIHLLQDGWILRGSGESASGQRLEVQGQHWGRSFKGSMMLAGANRTLELTLAPTCKSFTGTWRFDFRVSGEPFPVDGQVRRGKECEDGETRKCHVSHGYGVRSCFNGCWCSTCDITRCADGYLPIRSHPLSAGSCRPQLAASGSLVAPSKASIQSLRRLPWKSSVVYLFLLAAVLLLTRALLGSSTSSTLASARARQPGLCSSCCPMCCCWGDVDQADADPDLFHHDRPPNRDRERDLSSPPSMASASSRERDQSFVISIDPSRCLLGSCVGAAAWLKTAAHFDACAHMCIACVSAGL